MRPQAATQKDSPAELIPPVRPVAAWRVVKAEPLPDFRLRVCFVDGLEGVVDLAQRVRSKNAGVFSALANPKRFAEVRIEHGAVTWPGELDLAPDAMYDEIKKTGEWKLC